MIAAIVILASFASGAAAGLVFAFWIVNEADSSKVDYWRGRALAAERTKR